MFRIVTNQLNKPPKYYVDDVLFNITIVLVVSKKILTPRRCYQEKLIKFEFKKMECL